MTEKVLYCPGMLTGDGEQSTAPVRLERCPQPAPVLPATSAVREIDRVELAFLLTRVR